MRKGLNLMMILGAVMMIASCNKTKSYTDMLKAEQKAIDRLIDEEGLEILSEYPADGVFKDNQFYILDNGVYLNVIDSGNGNRYTNGTVVQSRFRVKFFMSDTIEINNLTYDLYGGPAAFTATFSDYYSTVVQAASGNAVPTSFISEGLASGLEYVGDSSYVKLIVPFKVSGSDFMSQGEPLYYTKVRYIFQK